MRSSTSLMALALASLSAVACTEPTPTGSRPSLSSAPEASGPIVGRSSSGFFFAAFDAQHGLFAIHIGRDGFGFCGEPFTLFHPGQFQDVLTPPDELLIQELFRAEGAFVSIYAWDGQDILQTDEILCDFLLNGPRLARGTAHLVNTDNDLLAGLRNEPIRADAFGFTAEGTVELTGGGRAHYSALSRFVFFPPDQIKVTERISLVPLQ
jgi:hypothetical protein